MEIIRGNEIVHGNPSKSADYPYALSSVLFDTHQLFVSSELVGPGKRSSAPHYHRERDEIVFVRRVNCMFLKAKNAGYSRVEISFAFAQTLRNCTFLKTSPS